MIKNFTQENISQTLEQRKEQALQIAQKCQEILLENGAL